MDMLFPAPDSVSVLTVNDYGDPSAFRAGTLLPPTRTASLTASTP